jgi:hypothetical protein
MLGRSENNAGIATRAEGDSGMGTGSAVSAVSMGSALLISNDPLIIEQLTTGMQQFAITSEVCADIAVAIALLNHRKFEAVVVDLKLGEQTRGLLEGLRLSPANGTAVTFAIADDITVSSKLEMQTNFVLERPLSAEAVDRMLKAAYGLIVRERRRYFRCPVEVPAEVWKNDTEQIRCQTMNVSEGGLAVNTSVRFRPGALVGVQFTLPGQPAEITAESEICWYDERSRAGLHFRSLSQRQKSLLDGWLSQRLEESLPESVASRFRKTVVRRDREDA